MPKLSIVATLKAAEGKEDELLSALKDMIVAAEEEPGLEIYSVHGDPNDPSTFTFFELYTGEEALAVHGKGDRMKAAMGALGGLLAGRPEVTMLNPIVAKGLDL